MNEPKTSQEKQEEPIFAQEELKSGIDADEECMDIRIPAHSVNDIDD
jgi:hypothetical protein